jgi:predicted porin
MKSFLQRFQMLAGVALPALMLVVSATSSANAQSANDAEVKALRAQVEALQKAVNQLTSGQQQSSADAKAAKQQADEAKAKAAQAAADAAKLQKATANANAALSPAKASASDLEIDAQGHTYLQHKKGNPLTFYTPGGEITAYGNIDISADATSKSVVDFGNGNFHANGAKPPVGNFGWLPAISTNSSYLGVRGFQRIDNFPLNFVYQFELGYDLSATPGLRQSSSNISDNVNGALFNRNTFIGFASPEYGAIKIGKTDAPYALSTGGFNPFAGQIGDYRVIVGNSGGDNRVEFGTRLDHSIWYESPTVHGFQFNALFSPGQNRSPLNDNIAAGESDCTGGNDPTSGGNVPISCSDGAYGNAFSTNLSYTNGGFYITAAYEFHQNVNRQSDIASIYGLVGQSPLVNANNCNDVAGLNVQAPPPNNMPLAGQAASNFTKLCNDDVANEQAYKIGALYTFASKTTIGAIFERLQRDVPAELQFQNERTRNDTWLVVSQQLTEQDSVHFGWAHAFKANGDPGQHNSGTLVTNTGQGGFTLPSDGGAGTFAANDNAADMITASYKRKFGSNLTWYTAIAATFNGPSAHYDLGAGGRGVTTDCHDAFGASGGLVSQPRCFTGTTIAGVSTGIQWRF